MKPSDTPTTRRLRATFWTTLASLLPLTAAAESTVFNADFLSPSNPVSVSPSVITPTSTSWFGLTSKTSGSLTASNFGPTITYSGSSGVLEMVNRFTPAASAISLAAVGDYIQAQGTFYTTKSSQVAVGLYNSNGVDPLVTTPNGSTMVGWDAGATAGAVGGTLGWKGYRGRMDTGAPAAQLHARQAQTGTPTYLAYDLISTGSSAFNSPGAISIGTTTASTTSITLDQNGSIRYTFVYKIERTAADALKITYTVDGEDASHYSATGTTSGATALPSVITSTFDALAIGVRGGTANPALQVTSLVITGKNAAIARIATQPVAQNIAQNGSGSLTVVAAGTGPISYQWYKDSAAISGATSATYSVASATSADVGNYYVVARNAYGSETSATVAVSVSSVSAPVFTTQPASQAVDAGTTLTLTSLASGVPTPAYQWYKDNLAISGATLATYTVAGATTADAGSYKVIATNSQGSTTSNIVTITINTAAPVITVQPVPVTVNVGQPIDLSVTATGLPAPTFQWYLGGVAISGATSATYSIPSAVTANAGTYTVTATNPYGAPTSNGVLVTVNVVAPSLTTQPPAALTVHYGKRVTLTAAYAGSAPLTYQWFKGSDPIAGAVGASYVIAAAAPADTGTYHVVVTNQGSSTASTNTVLSVVFSNESPVFATNFAANTLNTAATPITSSATSWFIMSGRTATNSSVGDDPLTTEVVETRPLTVTWVGTAGSAIVETAARFSATPVSLSNTGEYIRLRATLSGNNLRTLCFGLYNSGGVSPLALDGSVGGETTGGSTAVGGGTQNWVGYRSSLTAGNTSADAGTRPAQTGTSTNRGQELLFPAGSTSAAFGEPAGVAVGLLPSLATAVALADNTVYTLDYVITLSATNQYSISYSLYAGASATGTPLYTTNANTTTAAAQPSAVTTGFDALAFGLRNNDGATVPTLVITDLSVVKGSAVAGVAPVITTQPASQTLAPGATLTLTAAASGNPAPTFQWYKNNVAISGATNATYSIVSVTSADNGDYKVVATNAVSSATSNLATIIVGSASAYSTWASGQGLTTGVNDGATQDPDNDGVNNLLEFVLGGNPLSANASILPVATYSGSNLTLTSDIKIAAKTSYTIGAESSTDLVTWNAVVNGVAGATVAETALDGATNRLIVTVPAAGAKTFLRLKATPKP